MCGRLSSSVRLGCHLVLSYLSLTPPRLDRATCVVYSAKFQRAYVGDKGGSLTVIDVRQQRVAETLDKAHDNNITSLALDESEGYVSL